MIEHQTIGIALVVLGVLFLVFRNFIGSPRSISAILRKQQGGGVLGGKSTSGAAAECESIIGPYRRKFQSRIPYDALLTELGRAHARARSDPSDTYCYGVATYAEVLSDLLKMQKRVTGRNSYTLEQLRNMTAESNVVPNEKVARQRALERDRQLMEEERRGGTYF